MSIIIYLTIQYLALAIPFWILRKISEHIINTIANEVIEKQQIK